MTYDAWCSICDGVTVHSLGSCLRCMGQVGRQRQEPSPSQEPEQPPRPEQGSGQGQQQRSDGRAALQVV